ncbi:MAG: response regulator transcription factor [Candidatus Gracilibacteria bacterium]|nr:response regulator transcription factor [Candidatus Gracilibacteria bacterium]
MAELSLIQSYDIILVDINLGNLNQKNGLDIIEILRKKEIMVPIIVISGYNDIELIDKAFCLGANDYLTKPFRLQELEIRIMKWFKSYCINIIFAGSNTIIYKGLSYHFDTNQFYYKENTIDLTKKSKFILFQLLLHSEKLISEETLREKIWGDRELLKERNLRVNILRLKKSLEKTGIHNWIQNSRGEGYILKKIS